MYYFLSLKTMPDLFDFDRRCETFWKPQPPFFLFFKVFCCLSVVWDISVLYLTIFGCSCCWYCSHIMWCWHCLFCYKYDYWFICCWGEASGRDIVNGEGLKTKRSERERERERNWKRCGEKKYSTSLIGRSCCFWGTVKGELLVIFKLILILIACEYCLLKTNWCL